jgi:hypothetical protein
MTLTQLRRLRWFVLVVVLAGIGASVAMNVLHAPDNHWARFVAALPPLAVFGCLELVVRIPSSSKGLSTVRIGGASLVAAGAVAISYAQQRAAISDLDFPAWEAMIWPVIIDGMMIVASVSLVEVVRLIRRQSAPAAAAAASPVAVARVLADRLEAPATLAYREAQRSLRELSSVQALNGHKPTESLIS